MLTHKSRKMLLIAALAIFALVASAALLKANAGEKGAAQAAPAAAPAADPQFARMHEQLQLMQAQMDQLAKSRDPKERQRLLSEHLAAMQSMMTTMHGAAGGMMGGDTMCSHMMPMHQAMMDQMAQHQRAMMQPTPK